MWYNKLNNKRLWQIFSEISLIPRESGNEEGIRTYLLSWAEANGLQAVSDKIGNVIIYAPATAGCSKIPPIALQGHMDMVCVKEEDSAHDFTKDPLPLYVDGEHLRSKGTSLGADNGIAIAMILALISDPEAKHGPIEAIFTISEETGMDGANNIDASMISSRRMINLDSEEENVISVGCCGGIDARAEIKAKTARPASSYAFRISVSGLLGGHSGTEITKERGNAIHILAQFLSSLPSFQLSSINGGIRRNVIPSSAEAVIVTSTPDALKSLAKSFSKSIKEEYSASDPKVRLHVETAMLPEAVFGPKKSQKIVNFLYTAPTGVSAMSLTFPGIAEGSSNLAMVRTENGKVTADWLIRFSKASRKNDICLQLQILADRFGFSSETGGEYPSWEPAGETSFLSGIVKGYRKFQKTKPVISFCPGGLECGIINSRIPGMESVSIGPDVSDVHSVNEKLNIASAERMTEFLKNLLPTLK